MKLHTKSTDEFSHRKGLREEGKWMGNIVGSLEVCVVWKNIREFSCRQRWERVLGRNRNRTTATRFSLEVAVMVVRARWVVFGQSGVIPRQCTELVLPAVEWRAKAEAVLQFQRLRGGRPVHNVEVAHFITVYWSVEGQEIYSLWSLRRSSILYKSQFIQYIIIFP